MVNKLNDVILDNAQIVDLSTIVGDDSVGSSDVFDLKQADPSRFNVRLNWFWPTPNLGLSQVVTIVGGSEPDFSSGYFILAQQMFGSADAIAALAGPTVLGFRGSGAYVLPCSNVAVYTDGSTFSQAVRVCRYIQVWVQTVGAGSAVSFSALIEQQ
jgi:hypothetical protein